MGGAPCFSNIIMRSLAVVARAYKLCQEERIDQLSGRRLAPATLSPIPLLYAGGDFTTAGGKSSMYIAAWKPGYMLIWYDYFARRGPRKMIIPNC